jgi:hypothetical protein
MIALSLIFHKHHSQFLDALLYSVLVLEFSHTRRLANLFLFFLLIFSLGLQLFDFCFLKLRQFLLSLFILFGLFQFFPT